MTWLWLPLGIILWLHTALAHQHSYNYRPDNNYHNGYMQNYHHNSDRNSIFEHVEPEYYRPQPTTMYHYNANQPYNQHHAPHNKYLPPSKQLPYSKYLPPTQAPATPFNKYLPPPTAQPQRNKEPIITKSFYFVAAANDEDDEQPKRKHIVLGRPTRNYRVVFIKAPNSDNDNLKYTAELAPQEEKTIIYVLSKKDSELQIEDVATPRPPEATKPEVFFIKYKTKDEANAAQKEIQEQYDNLGGTNEYHDIGVAPVSSVIGSLETTKPNDDNASYNGGYNYQKPVMITATTPNANANAINNFLLPPEGRSQY